MGLYFCNPCVAEKTGDGGGSKQVNRRRRVRRVKEARGIARAVGLGDEVQRHHSRARVVGLGDEVQLHRRRCPIRSRFRDK